LPAPKNISLLANLEYQVCYLKSSTRNNAC
jgi:hypothetical protein